MGYLSKSGGSGFGPEFDKAAFALGKGEVSDTVKSSLGYHVIKVLNVEAEPTLEQAKARIEAALKLKKQLPLMLRKKNWVKIPLMIHLLWQKQPPIQV